MYYNCVPPIYVKSIMKWLQGRSFCEAGLLAGGCGMGVKGVSGYEVDVDCGGRRATK